MKPSYRIVLWGDNTYTVQKHYLLLGWKDISARVNNESRARDVLAFYREQDGGSYSDVVRRIINA